MAADVALASQLFASEFDLRVDDVEARRLQDVEGNHCDQLVKLLDKLQENSVNWWYEVARCWSSLGVPSIATSAVQRARNLVKEGRGVSWSIVAKLASFVAPAPTMKILTDEFQDVTRLRISQESLETRRARMFLLFGQGSGDRFQERIERAMKEDDLFRLVLFATTSEATPFDPGWLVREWYLAGELRATIEQFIGNLSSAGSFAWASRHIGPLIFCGKAFRQLGDHSTALACFRLAWWLISDDAQKPSKKEDGEDDHQQLRESLRELKWAGSRLDSDVDLLSWSTEPSAIGGWLTRNGLASRYPKYFRRFERSSMLRTPPQTLRHIEAMAERNGWFLPEIMPTFRASGQSTTLSPARIPSIPPAVEYQKHPASLCRAEIPPVNSVEVTNSVQFPQRLRERDVSKFNRVQIDIGFAMNESAESANVGASPGCPLLLAGEFVDDGFIANVIEQLRVPGRTVIHIAKGQRGLQSVWQKYDRVLRITSGPTSATETEELLSRLARSHELRKWAINALIRLMPECRVSEWQTCVSAVFREMQDSDFWSWLEKADDKERTRRAISMVSDAAELEFNHPRRLRQFVVLVERIVDLLSRVRSVACATWVSHKTRDVEVVASRLVTAILSENDSVEAVLLAIAILGSLWEDATKIAEDSNCPSPPVEEEFEFKLRKRKSASGTGLNRSVDDEANGMFSSWSKHDGIPSAGPTEFVFVLSGSFGPELPLILEGFHPRSPGFESVFILATKSLDEVVCSADVAELFHSIVIGPLTENQKQVFLISSGISIPSWPTPEDESLTIPQIHELILSNDCISHRRILIWPA